jgi:hypothetical protein
VFFPGSAQEFLHGHSRTKKNRAPARQFGQVKKVHYAGNVDAFPQGASNNGFHKKPPYWFYRLSVSLTNW